ncbi:flagellar assembly peptidoglycan hydrolase FlgJ [Aquabacterium sp. A3]|uniref:flagellar assembly peptidoglycan hydrolase FlgJ n=1 Tax=Aquabacterium sp. A3 TaxID=3132829 RepID=UPI0031199369
MSINTPSQGVTVDLRSLDQLKGASARDARGQVREVARQLEGLFMQELMKSMRATTMASGMLDNGGTELGTSMLDTQLSQQMTGLPGGLSDMIARQLERQLQGVVTPSGSTASAEAVRPPSGKTRVGTSASPRPSSPEAFIQQHQAAAKAAESATGIPAEHILGQAALESGWGKRDIRMPDGSSSHNLFGIKATSSWKGKVAEVTTTEYIGGVARKVTAKFRAYDSFEEAFKDHARLLTTSPRYSETAAKADTPADFAKGLQKGGYATDPAYADKLTRVIHTALRVQRDMA